SLPLACQSGGVGDPCIPEDEYDPGFAGFKVTEENIESRSFQCQTRICLVNHFQGRASCPLGQLPPTACNPDNPACPDGSECTEAAVFAPECEKNEDCASGACNTDRKVCECVNATNCPGGGEDGSWTCSKGNDPNAPSLCRSYVCFNPTNGCQSPDLAADNEGKACCVPGTNTPIAAQVCGQCGSRNSEAAVYCSCRCGPAEGSNNPEDENFNFCECPDGFDCAEIRKDVGLGDRQITGKYCIKKDSTYGGSDANASCGDVSGFFDSTCRGKPAL
ncbi:MAG TPA: hypothetical protein VLS89_08600, partial [Candidatus Nanopelagicales bacterium]|nr:hypothetical protein [Candidatus Nanopelagicales bacterium]